MRDARPCPKCRKIVTYPDYCRDELWGNPACLVREAHAHYHCSCGNNFTVNYAKERNAKQHNPKQDDAKRYDDADMDTMIRAACDYTAAQIGVVECFKYPTHAQLMAHLLLESCN